MVLIHRHETRSRPRQRNALFALNVAASHVLALLREWRRRSKERTQFAKLDDRMLKDIGLTGNGHMLQLEKNNHEIAAVMMDWLEKALPA